ncbi:MAG TPA: Hsp20 family protein [Devosia sp.]
MRTNIDFAPLNRFGVGFDRIFNLLENAELAGNGATWPAYDIARAGEDSYRISMAVPGFRRDDLEITQQPNLLVVTGRAHQDDKLDYLYRGIDHRSFSRRFNLADYVEVAGATLEDGVLTIELKRELPEAMKPRRIDIGSGPAEAEPQKQIEAQAA